MKKPRLARHGLARHLAGDFKPPAQSPMDAAASLGGVLETLATGLNRLAALAQDGGTLQESARHEFADGKGTAVFGYSVRVGRNGVSAEPFGHVDRATAPAPHAASREAALRQPLTEILTEGEDYVIVAEMPGADPGTLRCALRGDVVDIAASGAQDYAKTVQLPGPAEGSPRTGCVNGIVQVRVKRRAGAA